VRSRGVFSCWAKSWLFSRYSCACSSTQNKDLAAHKLGKQIVLLTSRMPVAKLVAVTGSIPTDADATVFVFTPAYEDVLADLPFAKDFVAAAAIDKSFFGAVNVLACTAVPGGRVVSSPTGPLNRDYDDVRRVADAVFKGIKRAVQAGANRPHLILHAAVGKAFETALEVSLVAALGALYAPLSVRNLKGEAAAEPVASISFSWTDTAVAAEQLTRAAISAQAIEMGKRIARDIGGGDPELMSPPNAAAYITTVFAGTSVAVKVIDNVEEIHKNFPLAHAVARSVGHCGYSTSAYIHAPQILQSIFACCTASSTDRTTGV
jgi:hypothetical protein